MLFVYVAFMGGLVQFCWIFLVDILSSSHSLGDFDTQCRTIFQRYVNLYINRVQDYILSPVCFESHMQLQLMEPVRKAWRSQVYLDSAQQWHSCG